MEKALFAGGCFWCMVQPFDTLPGIQSVVSGYAGGHIKNPTYEQVKSQKSGHTEVVQITFDPTIISFKELVEIYWQVTDPTDAMGQYMNRGDSYRPVIYYYSSQQKETAERSKKELEKSGKYKKTIVVPIKKAPTFYKAETEHQDFYKKNPERYQKEHEERISWINNI